MSTRLLFVLLLLTFSSLLQAQDEAAPMEEEAPMEEAPMENTQMEETGTDASTESNTVKMVGVRYLCELQGLTRRVEIDYETAGSSVPCSVNYFKDTEAPGEVNTLWNATNIEGYCEEKAAGFIGKLKSWGWSCTGG